MRDVVARAEGLGKSFAVVRSHRSVVRAMRALVRGESLRQPHWVLRGASFDIRRGQTIALLGRNGSGKTTLLRLLAGIYEQNEGSLRVPERPRALFHYAAGFEIDLSVLENIYLFGAVHGISRARLAPLEETILAESRLEDLRHVALRVLSTGQVQGLALSVFARCEDPFLIFDEALANVDRGFLERCHAALDDFARGGRTLLLTSHDPAFLRRHCEDAMWLDAGRIRLVGPLESVLPIYEETLAGASSPSAEVAAGA